jgi:hypothetical protein
MVKLREEESRMPSVRAEGEGMMGAELLCGMMVMVVTVTHCT